MIEISPGGEAADVPGAFGALNPQPADALLDLIRLYRNDPRPTKIDLGVGVYRDEAGATPVMQAVKAAEVRLAETQPTKSYLGAEGDRYFVESLAPIVFGTDIAAEGTLTGVQTPGGTGALRLAAELIARGGRRPSVWIGTPTWPNHGPIFREAGLKVRSHAFFDPRIGGIDFSSMMAELAAALPGDVLLLHGCCHNPTGAEFAPDEWTAIRSLIERKRLLPLIDLAYQGFGRGLDEDAAAMRLIVASLPEAIIAYSCDKNFGLYRDRVGALWVKAGTAGSMEMVRQNVLVLARCLWSMPPDHGAAAVREVLQDSDLTACWKQELEAMRRRLATLRGAIARSEPRLAALGSQRGMFAMLPVRDGAPTKLRTSHGIYMAESGRINIAGLRTDTIAPFIAAIMPHLDR